MGSFVPYDYELHHYDEQMRTVKVKGKPLHKDHAWSSSSNIHHLVGPAKLGISKFVNRPA